MRQEVLHVLRRILGTNRLQNEFIQLREDVRALANAEAERAALAHAEMLRAAAARDDVDQVAHLKHTPPWPVVAPALTILPGTPYSKFAIPLEYPPSRDLRPRWGNTHPLLKPLSDWMRPYEADYHALLKAIRDNGPAMSKIAFEYDPANLPEPAWNGVPLAPFDAAALYTIVGQMKPKLYLEIGSGITTAFAYRSIRDHGLKTRIVSIDPEPRAAIDGICDEVVRAGLETCDLAVFDQLDAGDILFFDGSHRTYMNSDVTVFMLEILPRIKPGVIVHVHDITLPWDYPEWAVPWYWNEQYILAAYIIGAAARLKPILPTTWVCRDAAFADWFATPPVDLGEANGGWQGGGSMWFTHTA